MSVTKQEFLDILNTIGVRASNRGFWNFGMADLISRMASEVINGRVTLCRAKGGTLEDDDSTFVVDVVPIDEVMKY